MANVGETTEVVNAEKVTLTDATNSRDWGQLYNIEWESEVPEHEHFLTDGTRETLDDPKAIILNADLLITHPEITTLVSYHTFSNEELPINNWDIVFTSKDTTADTLRIAGKVRVIRFVAPEQGEAWAHIRIKSDTAVITEP